MISGGERIEQVAFRTVEDFNLYARQATRVQMRFCYCSTMNECWMRDEREKDPSRVYHEQPTCPQRSADDFIDNDIAEIDVTARETQ